jgi:hypothetical protein
MRTIVLLTAAMALAATAGCATVESIQPGAGGSTFEVRGKTYDQVWKAAVVAVSRSLTIVDSDKASGRIRAEKGAGMATWGEVAGVFIRPAAQDAAAYTVEVQSLKRYTIQITGQDWRATIIANIKAELDL